MAKPDLSPFPPPVLARYLLSCVVPKDDMGVILGDMEEMYTRRRRTSSQSAQIWYWQQTLFSLPIFICHHMRTHGTHMIQTMCLTLALMLGVGIWDQYVVQFSVWRLATHIELEQTSLLRSLYIGGYAIYFIALGLLITQMAHRHRWHPQRPTLKTYVCMAGGACLPGIWACFNVETGSLDIFRIIQLSCAVMATGIGYVWGRRLTR